MDTHPYFGPLLCTSSPLETGRDIHMQWRAGSESLGPVNLTLLLAAKNASMAPIAVKMETKLLTSRASSLYSPSAPLHLQTLHSWWDPETSSHLIKAMPCLCHALYAVRLPHNAGVQLTSQLCLQSPLEWEWLTPAPDS